MTRGSRVAALALSLLAAPPATAQPQGKIHQIGLVSVAVNPGTSTVLWQGFTDGMRELGYVEGQNLVSRPHSNPPRRYATSLFPQLSGRRRGPRPIMTHSP